MINDRDSWSGPEKKPATPQADAPREMSAFQQARAKREHFRALQAKREYEVAAAAICETSVVQKCFQELDQCSNAVLAAWVDEIAPRLVAAKHPDRKYAILVVECDRVMAMISTEGRRLEAEAADRAQQDAPKKSTDQPARTAQVPAATAASSPGAHEISGAVSQAEFARRLGVARSWVTQLKKDGRLVFTPEGRVDVEASLARMAATSDPHREDVREFWAAQRGARIAEAESIEAAENGDSPDYIEARALKEAFTADLAELNYLLSAGELIYVSDVESILADVAVTFQTKIDRIPDRVSVDLPPAASFDEIKRHLLEHTQAALADQRQSFQKQLTDITKEAS